jgi:hypothetical protein
MNITEKLGITKGPWEHSEDSVWNEELDYGIVETGQYLDTRKEHSANLSLIAAAPEMLEALIWRVMDAERHYKGSVDGLIEAEWEREIKIIEKAAGKEWTDVKALLDE